MAAVNFPDPSATNPDTGTTYGAGWFNPDNGVTYEYNSGVWRAIKTPGSAFSDVYVQVAGDTMTGALSINDEIILNTDGSADF